jgi:hypothetical protein
MLNNAEQQIIILTGPNMSGKSAILRQTALNTLMAHMGSFVAASAAYIPLTDKIFTRVGASDNLSGGESTFMVEMNETASIINNISERSLIILDDVAGCFGKVGKPFSNITLGIEVDIIAVGKSISGGYSPIGAALLNDQVYNCIGQAEFDHTYTYNPNVDGIVAISAVLDKLSKNVFDTDQLVKKTSQILDELKIPFRNQGLCFDLIVDMQEKYMKFKETKLSFNICNTESIPLIVPIIADDEYFNFLRIELSKVYDI